MTRLGCELLFDQERAEIVQLIVETATGHPCPCKRGHTCPLLTERDLALPVNLVPEPRIVVGLGLDRLGSRAENQ